MKISGGLQLVIDYIKNDIKKIVCEDVTNPEQSFTVDLENKSLYNFKEQKVDN